MHGLSPARSTTAAPPRPGPIGRRWTQPEPPRWTAWQPGKDRDGSRVHCDSLDEGGAQLCPCGIATATPQHFTVASRTDIHKPARKFPARPKPDRCAPRPAHIRQIRAGLPFEGRTSRWFLAYSSPSRLPNPHHLAVLARPGFVRAAPTLPGTSRIRLPPASPPCCDRAGGEGLSPPLESSAPHGARGFRYSPTTSTTLASNSGSVENLNVSARHGCTPIMPPGPRDRRRGPPQIVGQQPRRPVRHPQLGRRRGQRRGHDPPRSTVRGRPGPLLIVQPVQPGLGVPVAPLITVCRDTPTRTAISVFDTPSEASSTIRARCASAARTDPDRTSPVNPLMITDPQRQRRRHQDEAYLILPRKRNTTSLTRH